jgi:hypothetical protein
VCDQTLGEVLKEMIHVPEVSPDYQIQKKHRPKKSAGDEPAPVPLIN